MTGRLWVVGLGPGGADLCTPRAAAVLEQATDLVGYGPYLDRVPARTGQMRYASDNRDEIARARQALALAGGGARVAVVSGGDAGVFGMASAVFEAWEGGDAAWRAIEPEVVPGVSAMLAAAARIGAPLGADFCAVSLSDNLKPWATVERRLLAAASAGFVLALYNPASQARPWQLPAAFALLRGVLPGAAPVMFARAIGRAEESVAISTLAEADPALADMRTLVLVGSEQTRKVRAASGRVFVYSPRRAA